MITSIDEMTRHLVKWDAQFHNARKHASLPELREVLESQILLITKKFIENNGFQNTEIKLVQANYLIDKIKKHFAHMGKA